MHQFVCGLYGVITVIIDDHSRVITPGNAMHHWKEHLKFFRNVVEMPVAIRGVIFFSLTF